MKQFNLIKPNEWPKFLCMGAMMFLITYVHSILKISKDALVISHLGAESISAIKMWLVLPMTIVFMFVYIKLVDVFKRSQLFHITSWFFLAYFLLFTLILYPLHDHITFNLPWLPERLKYIGLVVGNWPYSLFYFFSEMWVSVMLSISFWQAANHITPLDESKRLYPILGFVAQFGLMAASLSAKFFANNNWQISLNKTTITMVTAGILLSFSINALTKVVGNETFNGSNLGTKKKKVKMGFIDSLKMIFSYKAILLIASLLLCYNISINLMEGAWKKSIEILFNNDAGLIQNFMGSVSLYVSILSIVFSLVGMYIVRICKWRTVAMVTPLICLVFGSIFFSCVIFRNNLINSTIGISAIQIGVYVGAMQIIFARSSKFTLFDSTKEMAYIPLDTELRDKGKAAAELIGMRFGKGSGAFIQQMLLTLFVGSNLIDLAPMIATIFIGVIAWWLYSVFALNKIVSSKE